MPHEPSFREVILSLVQIGRDLTIIDDRLKSLNATAVVDDSCAAGMARDARLAAQRIAKEFFHVENCSRERAAAKPRRCENVFTDGSCIACLANHGQPCRGDCE